MKFEHSFSVAAPIEDVWTALMDIERTAPCVPGAEVLGPADGDTYRIRVNVTLGLLSVQPTARVRVLERDDLTRRAAFSAVAGKAGAGRAEARTSVTLVRVPDGTHATVNTDLQLTGTAAVVGQRVIAEVGAVLIRAYAANLERMLTQRSSPVEPTAPLAASSVVATAVATRLRERRLLVATALACAAIGYAIVRRHRRGS